MCTENLNKNPKDIKALSTRHSAYVKKSLYKEALADCNTIIQLIPNEANSYYIRGVLYEKMNMLNEGVADFTECLRINPNHYNAAYARGACENKLGNFRQAIADYDLALERDKRITQDNHISYYLLNKSNNRSSSVKGSRRMKSNLKSNCVINHTVRFNKENVNNEMKPANEYSLQRKSEIPTHNLPQEESEAEKYYKLGYEARKVNEFTTAIKFYTKAIEIEPKYTNCYYNRGFSYAKLNDHMNAITDYRKFIELEPDNGYAYYNLGISFNRVKQYEEAVKSFTQAIALINDNADFYCNRGFSYRMKGNYDLGVKDFNEAIKLSPNHFKVLVEKLMVGVLQSWSVL